MRIRLVCAVMAAFLMAAGLAACAVPENDGHSYYRHGPGGRD